MLNNTKLSFSLSLSFSLATPLLSSTLLARDEMRGGREREARVRQKITSQRKLCIEATVSRPSENDTDTSYHILSRYGASNAAAAASCTLVALTFRPGPASCHSLFGQWSGNGLAVRPGKELETQRLILACHSYPEQVSSFVVVGKRARAYLGPLA